MMADPLSARVEATPARTALIEAVTGSVWSYAELAERVTTTTGQLFDFGIAPGDHLGLAAPTSVEAIVTIHAAARLGATLVPLDPRLAEPELADRITRAGVDAVVTAPAIATTVSAATDRPCCGLEPIDGLATLSDFEVAPLDDEPAVPDPQLLLFTSGTTGHPKAVRLTAENLYASAVASAFRLGVLPDDRWLLCLPIAHMGGLAPVLRSTLYGTAVVVQEAFDPATLVTAIDDYEATGISLVPTMLDRLLETGLSASSLRFILLGGAPAEPALIERCAEADLPVYPTYGLTETASQVATATPDEASAHPGTVGQPLLGTTVRVLDADDEIVPPGEVGELVVSGPTVSPGYFDATGAAESIDPSGFRTGDLGRRDAAGRLWIEGRVDDLIITGGENVQPATVRGVLRQHPAVDAAAVVGVPDPDWGQRVVAVVVSTDDTLTVNDLHEFCHPRLAEYEQPKAIDIVQSLPRTPSGTVDRAGVRARFEG